MSIAITPEQLALRDAVRSWAERSGARAVARANADVVIEGTTTPDLPAGWSDLAELGLPGIHVPEEYGGAGHQVEDLAVAVEELGYALAAEPLWPTALASLCLLDQPDAPAAKALLPELADGSTPAAVAEFRRRFDLMTVQRNLKALGTFGYQTATRRNPVYIQYIPRTLRYARTNLEKYPRFARLRELLARHIEELQ